MTVFVRGLRFHSHHGVTDLERAHGQWLEAEIEAEIETRAAQTDRIEDTVDYVALANLLVETSRATNSHTLEHLAEAFARRTLEKWETVNRIRVEVSKPNPLLNPSMAAIGVRLEKSRLT